MDTRAIVYKALFGPRFRVCKYCFDSLSDRRSDERCEGAGKTACELLYSQSRVGVVGSQLFRAAENTETDLKHGFQTPGVTVPESLRHRTLVKTTKISANQHRTAFSLVTYNILADCHIQKDNVYYSYTEPQFLNKDYRQARILDELEYLEGDVVCLQEVSPDFYDTVLKDWFIRHGYDYGFIKRTADAYAEGCATFYKTSKFTCDVFETVQLQNISDRLLELLVKSNELAVTNTYTMHDVAIISKLRLKETNHEITVVNTHINYGGFVRTDIQLLQIAALKYTLLQRYADTPCIICGDFNAFPDTLSYKFATGDRLPDELWDDMLKQTDIQNDQAKCLRDLTNLSSSAAEFHSAYKEVLGDEPEVTCVDGIWRCCLDYIFYQNAMDLGMNKHCCDSEKTTTKLLPNLIPMSVLGMMSLDEILKATPPSHIYPSDHFPLLVNFISCE